MIVDHPSKINRNRPNPTIRCFYRSLRNGLVGLGLIAAMTGVLCQSSLAQESDKSDKATKVQQKPARKANRFKSKANRFVNLGSIEDPQITESSGVTAARPAADGTASKAIWTFNDSGGNAKFFRVSFEGKTEAELNLKGARNRDWETMCGFTFGDEWYLAVGDVGDNTFRRKSYQIYVVAEPAVTPKLSAEGKLKAQKLKTNASTIEFTYKDGSHNCEAMSYNTDDDTFWFVEKVYVDDKRKKAPGIYVLAKAKFSEDKKGKKPKNVAKRIADFPVRNVTGMAFSPDNQRLVIRSYFGAWLFDKADGKTWQETVTGTKPKTIPLPLQTQGEAICFGPNSQTLLVTSEFKNAIIWKVKLDQNAPEREQGKDETGK